MRSRQAGDSKIGCILWILALGIAVMVAVKMLPIKLKSAELQDHMTEQAKFARGASVEGLQKAILHRASQLDLPVSEKDVQIQLTRDRVKMDVKYTVPVEFPGYTYQWSFHHSVDRPIYII
jgi:hypothetical protein